MSGAGHPDPNPNPNSNPNPNLNLNPNPNPNPNPRHARVLQSWQGLVESRLRKLTDVPYLGTLPLKGIRLFPKKHKLLTAQKDAQNGQVRVRV